MGHVVRAAEEVADGVSPFLSRKFIVVMVALLGGLVLGFTCEAATVAAYSGLASICVGAYMGAHAMADSKWAKPDVPKP